ncbi:hypothetical protein HPB48_003372 [Haemaphysalis longicornis]|uniref:Uncharacterized protein n=1 Tax=Haemaphysalis longicornis TaxID=44386 RepID=A0A9J6GE89_HAELO|nr:hypothetical protein HPB48_003372 [Haemaphysalis longicornis]
MTHTSRELGRARYVTRPDVFHCRTTHSMIQHTKHLGSHHNMILIDIDFAPPRIKWRRQQLTDWEQSQSHRSQVSAKDITEWTDQLKQAWKKFTQYPVQYEGNPLQTNIYFTAGKLDIA